MTTPRVTVPVEPEYTATDYLRLIAEGWEVIESTGSQMTIQNPEDDGPQDLVIDVDAILSAAPAPEGGAVNHEALAKVGYEASCNKKWEWASRGCKIGWIDAVKAITAALATREEAPAEAAAKRLREDLDEGRIKDFAVSRDVATILSALRAQPPAREDALRVALEEARDAVTFFDQVKAATQDEQIAVGRDHWNRMEAALRRLAALQAEQKGGA